MLLVAAALRFTGLGWGLRHPSHIDEAFYVDNVREMVKAGDLDHRYYNYPGLFFYLLAPGVLALGPEQREGAWPFLVSRGLVAFVGVLNVALLYAVGSRLLGPAAGLGAAALLAVSPIDVQTSHQVRPDVLLEGFGILAIGAFHRIGSRLRDDLRAGVVIGLATAVKFTGLLMVPFYVAARLLRPGPRLRGLLAAGGMSVLVPVLATPYALLHLDQYWRGPTGELGLYYGPWSERPSFLTHLFFYLGAVGRTLGPLGTVAAVAGAVLLLRRSPRDFAPPLLHPAAVLVVMATATVGWPRLILPGMGFVYLCAGHSLAAVSRLSPAAGALAGLLTVALPLGRSTALVNLMARPSPADLAVDWIDAYVPAGSRILETRVEAHRGRGGGLVLGLDPARYEVVSARAGEDDAIIARLVPHFDLVVADRGRGAAWSSLLVEQHRIHYPRQPSPYAPLAVPARGPVALRLLAPRERASFRSLDLEGVTLHASENEPHLGALTDADPATGWATSGPGRGGEWVEVTFPRDTEVSVVEVELDPRSRAPHPVLRLQGAGGNDPVRPLRTLEVRPPLSEQALARTRGSRRPLSARLVLEGSALRTLRISLVGATAEPWSIAALTLEGPEVSP